MMIDVFCVLVDDTIIKKTWWKNVLSPFLRKVFVILIIFRFNAVKDGSEHRNIRMANTKQVVCLQCATCTLVGRGDIIMKIIVLIVQMENIIMVVVDLKTNIAKNGVIL